MRGSARLESFEEGRDGSRRIYCSTGVFPSRDIDEILRTALDSGIHRLELGSGVMFRRDLLEKVRAHFGAPFRYLIHNYFPPPEEPFVLNLAARDSEMLARSRRHCRVAIDLAAEFGADFYSVHSGFALHARPEQLGRSLLEAPSFPYEEAYAIFVGSVIELNRYAASRGVRFLVENNVVAPFNLVDGGNAYLLMARANELIRLWRDVASPNLGFLIDVGHVNVTARTLGFDRRAFLDTVGPHVAAFHLSDNCGDADDNLPFDERAWFLPVLRNFPSAVMIIEAYRMSTEQTFECIRTLASAMSPQ